MRPTQFQPIIVVILILWLLYIMIQCTLRLLMDYKTVIQFTTQCRRDSCLIVMLRISNCINGKLYSLSLMYSWHFHWIFIFIINTKRSSRLIIVRFECLELPSPSTYIRESYFVLFIFYIFSSLLIAIQMSFNRKHNNVYNNH